MLQSTSDPSNLASSIQDIGLINSMPMAQGWLATAVLNLLWVTSAQDADCWENMPVAIKDKYCNLTHGPRGLDMCWEGLAGLYSYLRCCTECFSCDRALAGELVGYIGASSRVDQLGGHLKSYNLLGNLWECNAINGILFSISLYHGDGALKEGDSTICRSSTKMPLTACVPSACTSDATTLRAAVAAILEGALALTSVTSARIDIQIMVVPVWPQLATALTSSGLGRACIAVGVVMVSTILHMPGFGDYAIVQPLSCLTSKLSLCCPWQRLVAVPTRGVTVTLHVLRVVMVFTLIALHTGYWTDCRYTSTRSEPWYKIASKT